MVRIAIALALAVVAALSVSAPALARAGVEGPTGVAAAVRQCSTSGLEINFGNLVARNMSCGRARAIIRRMRGIQSRFRVRGYTCRQISGGAFGGTWRCVKSRKVFRFDFGD
jgi:hypothetical protein